MSHESYDANTIPVSVHLPVYESYEIAKLEVCARKLWPSARAASQQTMMFVGKEVLENR